MGTAIRGSCFFRFFSRTRRRGVREGSDPLALSRGTGIRGSCFFRFFSRTRRRGSERVPSLSLSPMGTAIRGFYFFCFFEQTRRRGMREGSDPLALSRGGCDSRLLTSFISSHELAAEDARGFRPSRVLPWGCDSRLSTSFASPFVSPYSSGMRTVSDWGGTVTAVDSFLGCAESRFAERKSVWVMASGSVTRISRSAERLYTR